MKTPLFRRPHRDQNACLLLFLVVTIIVGLAALARADVIESYVKNDPSFADLRRDHDRKVARTLKPLAFDKKRSAAAIRPLELEYLSALKRRHKWEIARKADSGRIEALVAEIDRMERKTARVQLGSIVGTQWRMTYSSRRYRPIEIVFYGYGKCQFRRGSSRWKGNWSIEGMDLVYVFGSNRHVFEDFLLGEREGVHKGIKLRIEKI